MMAQPTIAPDRENRLEPRTRLFLSATISFDRSTVAIRIRDLSAFGARIEGVGLPPVGVTAQICRATLSASGTIIWRDSRGCGVRFDQPLDLEQWIPGLAAVDQLAVDAMVEAVRTNNVELLPLPSRAAPSGREGLAAMLPQRLAEELAYVARLLDSLGDDLCGEPMLVLRHATKLQDLDISAQILGHVAAVLVADRPEQAIESIGMTGLRKRLQRTAL